MRARWAVVSGVVSTFAAVTLAASALVGGATAAAAWPNQQCPIGGKTSVVQPGISGEQLERTMSGLSRGDTLRLAPGVYDIGKVAVYACHADPDHRITITALDPANPPLLRGWLFLLSPDYWTLSNLRVEATVRGQGAMHIAGGTGWTVDRVEMFGAAKTVAYGTLMLNARSGVGPRDFSITNSCIHDGATKRGEAGFHGIYAAAAGSGGSASGVIADNVIFGFPGGSGVKLGAGGARGTLGPWNVRVEHNTILNSTFGVVMHGRLKSESVAGNLMGGFIRRTGNSYRGSKSAAIYAHELTGSRNIVAGNYFYGTDLVLRTTGRGRPTIAKSNVRGPSPAFSGGGCGVRVSGGRAAGFGARR